MCFGLRSRMRHRTLIGRTDVLGIAPECSRLIIIGAWRPCSTPVCQYGFLHHQVDGASIGIDGDHIPILNQGDRATVSSFRTNMTNAEATRAAREANVSDERHLLPATLTIERRRRRKRFPHAWPAQTGGASWRESVRPSV